MGVNKLTLMTLVCYKLHDNIIEELRVYSCAHLCMYSVTQEEFQITHVLKGLFNYIRRVGNLGNDGLTSEVNAVKRRKRQADIPDQTPSETSGQPLRSSNASFPPEQNLLSPCKYN